MRIPTVMIETENGPVVINKDDFNPEIHKLADTVVSNVEPVPEPPPQPLNADGLRTDGPTIAEFVQAGYLASNYPPAGYASRSTPEEIAEHMPTSDPTTSPDTTVSTDTEKPLVAAFGDRFYIVNSKGDKLTGKGINPAGYASNEKAWEAVQKLAAGD